MQVAGRTWWFLHHITMWKPQNEFLEKGWWNTGKDLPLNLASFPFFYSYKYIHLENNKGFCLLLMIWPLSFNSWTIAKIYCLHPEPEIGQWSHKLMLLHKDKYYNDIEESRENNCSFCGQGRKKLFDCETFYFSITIWQQISVSSESKSINSLLIGLFFFCYAYIKIFSRFSSFCTVSTFIEIANEHKKRQFYLLIDWTSWANGKQNVFAQTVVLWAQKKSLLIKLCKVLL